MIIKEHKFTNLALMVALILTIFLFVNGRALAGSLPPSGSSADNPSNTQNCKIGTSPTSPGDTNYPYDQSFLGLVPWYHYLLGHFSEVSDVNSPTKEQCTFQVKVGITCANLTNATPTEKQTCGSDTTSDHVVGFNSSELDVIWLIGLAIFEDLLRVAGAAALIFVTIGGVRYITSQGNPENTKNALETIRNALIGLAIASLAAIIVGFIGSKLGAI